MSRRTLREQFKIQILSVKRQAKKDRQEKGVPTFRNLEISYDRVNDNNIGLVVSDILEREEKQYKSLVLATDKTGATFIITKIKCPACGATLALDKKWMCFICSNPEHKKKSFEIISAS